MTELSRNRRAFGFRLLTILLGLAALSLVTLTQTEMGLPILATVLLATLAFISERYPLELPGYGVVSGLQASLVACLCLGQEKSAILVLIAGVASRSLRRGANSRLDYTFYSFFQLSLAYLGPFVLLHHLPASSALHLSLAALLAVFLDQVFAALHLYLLQGRLGHFASRIEWAKVRLSALVLLPLGLLLASCMEQGPVATALLLVPLSFAFFGIKTYVDTLTEAREVVASMVEAVERRESGTAGHAARVADWAGSIAREMGLHERTVRRIVTAAQMHDLGKIGIDESILNKVGELSEEEVGRLRRHPEVGAKVASHLSLGKQEAEFIFHHHEHFDGSGYPSGLAGNDIPQGARILAVAEAFDSMISTPRGKGMLTPGAALAELESAQGQQFDPSVVAAFKSVFRKRIA